MGRRIRVTPPGGTWMCTFRCDQQMMLLRPDHGCNQIFGFTLAQALEYFPGVGLLGCVAMGNHVHLLLHDRDGELSRFEQYFESLLARRINAHRERRGHFVEDRFSCQPILGLDSLLECFVYVICNPVRAGLVASWRAWPGVLLWAHQDRPMHHTYELFDEAAFLEACQTARRRGEPRPSRHKFTKRKTLVVEPWRDDGEEGSPEDGDEPSDRELAGAAEAAPADPDAEVADPAPRDAGGYHSMESVVAAVKAHEREIAAERHAEGKTAFLGASQVLEMSPFDRPKESKRSEQPLCFAPPDRWVAYRDWYSAIVMAFKDASARLRDGDLLAEFPAWTHPPGQPLLRPAPG